MYEKSDTKQNMQEYNLSLRQFARLCGTTRDTLRFYYENDLLIPRIDEANGYHYYSASQISSYFFISTFRQAGCSIKEIRELIRNSTKDSVQTIANTKLMDMQKELDILQNKMSSLSLGLQLLENHNRSTSSDPFIEDLPGIRVSCTPITHSPNARHTGDIATDLSQHLTALSEKSNLSIFPTGVTMSYKDLTEGNYIYNNIITLTSSPSDDGTTSPLPRSRVLSCYHDTSGPSIDNTYEKIVKCVKENNYKVCSDLYIISLFNLYDGKEKHNYFKYIFLCIE